MSEIVQLKRYEDINEFYNRVEPFLLEREAQYCLMLGISTNLMKTNLYPEPPYLACVEQDGQVVAVAMRTPPHRLVLSDTSDQTVLALIAADVQQVYQGDLVGVIAPKEAGKLYSDIWSSITRQKSKLNLAEGVYKLSAVRPVAGVVGHNRPATAEDRDLLVKWLFDFAAEALDGISYEQAERDTDARLNRDPDIGGFRVWCVDGQMVSYAGYGGKTPNGMRIGPVYTPPELRGRGYASACVATLSQELLDQGRKFCFLFTDLGNPTSNHIYQQIGYEMIGGMDDYVFGEAAS